MSAGENLLREIFQATPVERLQAAIEWIERADKLRVYRAPETLNSGEKWSIGVWSANLAILRSALGDSEGSHDEPNAFRLGVDLADAILAVGQ